MLKTWTRRLLPLVIITVALAIAFAMLRSRSDLPRKQHDNVPPVVDVLQVVPGPVTLPIRSQGTVRPKREIDLVSEVSGRVVWVAPELVEGGRVEQGAVLLKIDPIDYEVALSEARAAVASAELGLAEVKVVLMRAAIDEAEARLEATRDKLRQAQVDLANTTITVPFDAVIDKQYADLGQYVQTGAVVMRLLSTDAAEIRLPILASDVPFIRYGQQDDGSWPQVLLRARFGEIEHSWAGRLLRLEDRVDEQTRVFYLVAEVERPYDGGRHARPLSVGMFVEADIQGEDVPQATSVPRSALYDNNHVYLVEGDRLLRREVTVLRRDQDRVIVGEGLSRGEQVVLSKLDLMVEGMPVTVLAK